MFSGILLAFAIFYCFKNCAQHSVPEERRDNAHDAGDFARFSSSFLRLSFFWSDGEAVRTVGQMSQTVGLQIQVMILKRCIGNMSQISVKSDALPKVGDRIRIALNYQGIWRPLMWLRLGSDGSIYTGLIVDRPNYVRLLQKESSDPSGSIDYSEGKSFTEEQLPNSSRISFKASGEIHGVEKGKMLQGPRLEKLTKTTQLCLFAFAHPSRYSPPRKKLPNDYDVGIQQFRLEENSPLSGALYVSPLITSSPLVMASPKNMKERVNLFFGFQNLHRTPDLVVQVVIGQGVEGEWPPYPFIVLLTKPS